LLAVGLSLLATAQPARAPAIIVGGLTAGYAVSFTWYAWINHALFRTNAYDLGLYDQTLYLLSRFQPAYSTGAGIHMVGSHAAIILFPLASLYWIWPDPRMLLLFQSLSTALGAIPLYLIGRTHGRPWLGLVAGAAYLLHPATQNMTLFDFHVDTLAATALIWALWAIEEKRWRMLAVAVAVVLACKENFAITIGWLGVWLLLRRQWRPGLALSFAGAAWFAISTRLIVPAFLGRGESLHISRFRQYGDTLPEIMLTALLQPGRIIADMIRPDTPDYLFSLLAPLGGLPLLAPHVLVLALPGVAINLISGLPAQRTTLFHYNALVIAIAAVAALQATIWIAARLDKLAERTPHSNRRMIRYLPSLLLALIVLGSTGWAQSEQRLRRDDIQAFLSRGSPRPLYKQYLHSMIPSTANVSAASSIQPHVSRRNQAFLWPNPFERSDFYQPERMPFAPRIDYIVYDAREDPTDNLVSELRERGLYRRIIRIDGMQILERVPGAPDHCYADGWQAATCRLPLEQP
jgi:uncharacterized membrane protein